MLDKEIGEWTKSGHAVTSQLPLMIAAQINNGPESIENNDYIRQMFRVEETARRSRFGRLQRQSMNEVKI